jgi:hypothetical protein
MSWVNVCQSTIRRGVSTFVYVNNHYAGFAPRLNSFKSCGKSRLAKREKPLSKIPGECSRFNSPESA